MSRAATRTSAVTPARPRRRCPSAWLAETRVAIRALTAAGIRVSDLVDPGRMPPLPTGHAASRDGRWRATSARWDPAAALEYDLHAGRGTGDRTALPGSCAGPARGSSTDDRDPGPISWETGHDTDLVDNLPNRGVTISGEVMLGLAGADMVYLRLQAMLRAADRVTRRPES